MLNLTVKNKLGFVDDSTTQVTDDLKSFYNPTISSHTLDFLNSLRKEIFTRINFADTARDIIWQDLQQSINTKIILIFFN